MTDAEILERRYPVVLQHFSLAGGTGGEGTFRGGDGVLRQILFRKPLTLSVLTERRVLRPFGLAGGGDGQRGLNTLLRARDGRVINLGGKCTVPVEAGDVFNLRTPGGGAWGEKGANGQGVEGEGRKEHKFRAFIDKGSLSEYSNIQHSA